MSKIVGFSVAFASTSVYLIRSRISKKWINCRSSKHDLTNKIIIITGGNTGLGFEAAKDFARRNAKVIIACRNMPNGEKAVDKINRANGNENALCMELDLASMASVQEFATKLNDDQDYPKIDALVCNAGVWVPETAESKKTQDGLEIHFGVNHLSHMFLTKKLRNLLHNSGDGRVIFVSSSLMKSGKIDFEKYDHIYESRKKEDDQKSFAPPAYCDTKLMNALTCRSFSKVLPPTVGVYAVCPGFCRSSLGRHVSYPFYKKMLIAPIMLMLQRSPRQGAQNIIFATVEDKSKLKSGEFYRDGEIAVEQTDYVDSLGEDLPAKLWDISEGIYQKFETK